MAILGIDEVGRGPWAGPLVIGAVVLNPRYDQTGNPIESESWQDALTDSKKLTVKKREKLSPIIMENAVATGLGWVSASELDEIGLSRALKLATRRAVENIPRESFTEIIIDGTQNFLKDTDLENLVSVLPKADLKIKEVSAASIIAKVARDSYMVSLAEKYPGYGFEKHVGYGTALHKSALEKLGPCPEHRKSFRPVMKVLETQFSGISATTGADDRRSARNEPRKRRDASLLSVSERRRFWPEGTDGPRAGTRGANARLTGLKAEGVVADYLSRHGHTILARNYKTKYYEIDIVSATKDHIYFTEVKYRKNNSHGDPLDFIDQKKQKQITFAANAFMKYLSKKLNRDLDNLPSPILAAASVSGPNFTLDKWLELVV